MESAEAVAAKRRVLIDALMMCLSKSRVVQVADAKTVRSVLDSAAGELWREGEFRLEPVWKILIAQPGLTAEDVAPPLLVFKAYEGELGVQVRMPQALTAIPRGEQVRLRDALGIQRQDFARAIDEMRELATQEASARKQAQILRDAESTVDEPTAKKKPKKKENKVLAAVLAGVAVLAVGTSLFIATRDTSAAFDFSDVAGTLQLANGRAVGPSLTATIVDPKWETLPLEERKAIASQLLDAESAKGIRALILLDKSGTMRAMVSDTPNGRSVMVP